MGRKVVVGGLVVQWVAWSNNNGMRGPKEDENQRQRQRPQQEDEKTMEVFKNVFMGKV